MEPSAQEESEPRVASDGQNFLVVWSSSKSVPFSIYGQSDGILAARVTGSGELLDQQPIVVIPPESSGAFDVGFGGGRYLVVVAQGEKIFARSMGPSGDLGKLRQINSSQLGGRIALGWNGSEFLAIWHSVEGLAGVFLDPSGTPRGNEFIFVEDRSLGVDFKISPAPNGHFLIVFQKNEPNVVPPRYGLYSLEIGSQGERISERQITTRAGYEFVVAFAGDRNLIVWQQGSIPEPRSRLTTRNRATDLEFWGSFVRPNGEVAAPFRLQDDDGYPESLFWNGQEYLLSYRKPLGKAPDLSVVHTSRFSSDGALLSTREVSPRESAYGSRLAWNGTRYLLVFRLSQKFVLHDIFATILDARAEPVLEKPFAVAYSPATQRKGDIVRSDDGYLVVWREVLVEEGQFGVFAARLNRDGSSPDGRGIRLGEKPLIRTFVHLYDAEPKVAFDGSTYVVVWLTDAVGRARRLSKAGQLLDPRPLEVSLGEEVSWDGTNFLLIGTPFRFEPPPRPTRLNTIGVARLRPSGQPLDSEPLKLAPETMGHYSPDVEGSLVVSHEPFGQEKILGWIIPPSGSPFRFVVAPEGEIGPRVAQNGDRYLVAWLRQDRSDVPMMFVDWRIVSSAGVVSGPPTNRIPFQGVPVRVERPAVAPFGSGFMVAWAQLDGSIHVDKTDIYGILLDRNGNRISDVFPIATTSSEERVVALSQGTNNGEIRLLYERFAEESPYRGVWRLFTRSVFVAR